MYSRGKMGGCCTVKKLPINLGHVQVFVMNTSLRVSFAHHKYMHLFRLTNIKQPKLGGVSFWLNQHLCHVYDESLWFFAKINLVEWPNACQFHPDHIPAKFPAVYKQSQPYAPQAPGGGGARYSKSCIAHIGKSLQRCALGFVILRLDMPHVWNFSILENDEQAMDWHLQWKHTTFVSGDTRSFSSRVVYFFIVKCVTQGSLGH